MKFWSQFEVPAGAPFNFCDFSNIGGIRAVSSFPPMEDSPNTVTEHLQDNRIRRSKFTAEEDEEIRLLVATLGTDSWDKVAEGMTTQRGKRQVRERWNNYLRPDFEPRYTEVEQAHLDRLVLELGPRWALIAAQLGNKSPTSVRNQFRRVQTKRAREPRPLVDQNLDAVTPIVKQEIRFDDGNFDGWDWSPMQYF
jgi:hypothetical protein